MLHQTANKSNKKNTIRFRPGWFTWKRILILLASVTAGIFLLSAAFIWSLLKAAPDIDTITVSPTESATYICDPNGNYLQKLTLASSNRDIVSLDAIPKSLQHAVIAIEDARFYQHGGIDVRGIARAFVKGLTSGSFSEGASTITQQLIKNNVFTEWTQENSFADRFRRKIQEQYLAIQLENRMSKEEILENYLNTINLGAGCYGVQAASRRYFGKDVSELTLSEAAVLASIPQNPSYYNPILDPQANHRRRAKILDYMQEQGYISSEEKEEAISDDVYARIRHTDEELTASSVYSYYEDALIDQVIDLLIEEKHCSHDQAYRAVYSGGLRIFTAQDPALQKICEEAFQNPANFPEGTQYGIDYALSIADKDGLVTHYGTDALRSYVRQHIDSSFNLMCSSPKEAQTYADAFRDDTIRASLQTSDTAEVVGERLTLSPQPQASLVLMDQRTGFVRAVVGGRGEKTASLTLNRATDTTRQPGSTFKILTAYAPALESFGKTLATQYKNEPTQYENGTPVSNWDITDYSGTATIREAITRSINVIAVKCITEISPAAGFACAERLGISTLHASYETDSGTASDLIQPLALGGITQGVTNLELCSAYAAIANGGIHHPPRFFTKILDRHGNLVLDGTPEGTRALSESTSFLLTDAMCDVVSSPSGTAYGSIQAAGQPVAGKTGTTSSYKDIWFVGYTPYYTCSVWGGYDNNEELPSGSTYHSYNKVLWSDVMNRIHAALPPAAFKHPETVLSAVLCRDTGLPAVAGGCPDTYLEYFAAGTQPKNNCPLHEPQPETDPITIYPQILDQLMSEPESETDTGAVLPEETPNQPPEGESHPNDAPMPDAESKPNDTLAPEADSSPDDPPAPETDSSPDDHPTPNADSKPDTTSLEDLLIRLEQSSYD